MSAVTGGGCGCAGRNDWSDAQQDAGECMAEGPDGLACSKPDGHDGPHAACSVHQHPMEVWEEDPA